MWEWFKKIYYKTSVGKFSKLKKEYKKMIREHRKKIGLLKTNEKETNKSLKNLVFEKKKSIILLKKLKKFKIFKRELGKIKVELGEKKGLKSFDEIEEITFQGSKLLGLFKGIGSSAGTGFTSWALVGNLATSSTGTAIVTLNGVAKTNAILAWFGGGSLAVGGGGMVAGAFTLGGIIIIPTLIINGLDKFYKVKEKTVKLEKKLSELKKSIVKIEDINDTLIKTKNISNESIKSIKNKREVLYKQYIRVDKILYPKFILSKLFYLIKSVFSNKDILTENEYNELNHLYLLGSELAVEVNKNIFIEKKRNIIS